MKRDPPLAGLSREHLPALILAYRLRHGRSSNPAEPWPGEPAAQRCEALGFVHGELLSHFEAEERFLIPLQVQLTDPAPSQRVLAEHGRFRELVAALEAAKGDELPAQLIALGELLEAHIRFEERVWFEQLQRDIPANELTAIGLQIEAFLKGG